jgi:hypothetical protein
MQIINFDPNCILATIKSADNKHASAIMSTDKKLNQFKKLETF